MKHQPTQEDLDLLITTRESMIKEFEDAVGYALSQPSGGAVARIMQFAFNIGVRITVLGVEIATIRRHCPTLSLTPPSTPSIEA